MQWSVVHCSQCWCGSHRNIHSHWHHPGTGGEGEDGWCCQCNWEDETAAHEDGPNSCEFLCLRSVTLLIQLYHTGSVRLHPWCHLGVSNMWKHRCQHWRPAPHNCETTTKRSLHWQDRLPSTVWGCYAPSPDNNPSSHHHHTQVLDQVTPDPKEVKRQVALQYTSLNRSMEFVPRKLICW